ncbi:MAG: cupin domain-containing protein [Spirochaetes bacterium]|nr:cupin domain-containing protein [Spirochaetota bacterium]
MAFYNFNNLDFKKKRDRVYLKSITGEKLQLTIMKLLPGEVTDHSHEHEQMGYILSGQVELTIGNEKKTLIPGEGY